MMNRVSRASSLLTLAAFAAGCTLSVNSTLDGKGDTPTSTCELDIHCAGANNECTLVDDGVTQYRDCVCASGFAPVDGSEDCEWDDVNGIVQYPGFHVPDDAPEAMPPEVDDVWSRHGDLTFDDGSSGGGDDGSVSFTGASICEYARVSQLIDLSPLSVTGPMVIEATWRPVDDFGHGGAPLGGVPLGIGINGHWTSMRADDSTDQWETQRICLGDVGAGRDVSFSVGPYGPIYECLHSNSYGIELSRADIVPANPDECPTTKDEVENADFEGSVVWDLEVAGGNATASLLPAEGDDGSQALEIITTQNGFRGSALTNVVLSENAEAISFWWRATAGITVVVAFGSEELIRLVGTGGAEYATVCIPPYLRGSGAKLSFGTPREQPQANWSVVGDRLLLDNVAIHRQSECTSANGVQDASFELVRSLGIEGGVPDYSLTDTRAMAVDDPLRARTGNASYVMQTVNSCNTFCPTCTGQPVFRVSAPPADESGGSALTFWYLAEDMPGMQARTTLDGNNDWLPENLGGWQKHTICLSDHNEGRPTEFRFVYMNATTCGAIPPEEILIDDLAGYRDSSCP